MFQLKPPSIKYEDEVFNEINRNQSETSAVGEILTDKTITRDAIHIKKPQQERKECTNNKYYKSLIAKFIIV